MEIDASAENDESKPSESDFAPAVSLGDELPFLNSTPNFNDKNLDSNIVINPFRALNKKAQKRKLFRSDKRKKKFKKCEQIETINLTSSSDDECDEVIFIPLPNKQQQIINLDSDEDDKVCIKSEDTIDKKKNKNINNISALNDIKFLKPLSPTNSFDKRFENSSCCTSPSSIISYDDFIMHNDRQRVKKNVQSDEVFFPGIDDSLAEAPVQRPSKSSNEDLPKELEKNGETQKGNNKILEEKTEALQNASMNAEVDLKPSAANVTQKNVNIYDSDSSMSEVSKLQAAKEAKVKQIPKFLENSENFNKDETSSLSTSNADDFVVNLLSKYKEIVENPYALCKGRIQEPGNNSNTLPNRKDDNCFFAQLRLLAEGNDDDNDLDTNGNSNDKEVDSVFQKVNINKNSNESKTTDSTELFENEDINDPGIVDKMNNLEKDENISSDKSNDHNTSSLIKDREGDPKDSLRNINENNCLQKNKESIEGEENKKFIMPSPPPPPRFPKKKLNRNFSSFRKSQNKNNSQDPSIIENVEKSLDESNIILLENDDEENSISKNFISNEKNNKNKDESFVVIEDDEDDNLPSTSASLRAKIMRNQAKNSTATLKANDKKSSNDEKETTSIPTSKSDSKKNECYYVFYNIDVKSQDGIGWCEEQIRFYEKSWNGENFDVDKLLNKMNNDRKDWKISPTDQARSSCRKDNRLKCFNCYNIGHRKADCPHPLKNKRCRICGEEGHLEPECPNKCCLRCGAKSTGFYRNCNNCAFQNREKCNICNYMGHNANHCPDRWRRYHSTTRNVGKLQANYSLKNRAYCSYCGKPGHFAEACRKERHPRDYPNVTSRICSYDSIYNPTPNAAKHRGLPCHLLYTPYEISVTNKSLFAPVQKSPLYSRILNEIGLSDLLKQKRVLDQSSTKSTSANKKNKYEDTEHQQRPKQTKQINTPKKQDSDTSSSKSNPILNVAGFDENFKVFTTNDNNAATSQSISFRPYVSPFGTISSNTQVAPNSQQQKKNRTILPLNEQNNGTLSQTQEQLPQPQPAKIPTVIPETMSQQKIKVRSLKSLCIDSPKTSNPRKSLMPLSIPNLNASLPYPAFGEKSKNNYNNKNEIKGFTVRPDDDNTEIKSPSISCPLTILAMDSDSNYSFSDHFDENIKVVDTESTIKDRFNRLPIGSTPDFIPILSDYDCQDENAFVRSPRSPSHSPPPPPPPPPTMERAKIVLIPRHAKFLNTPNGKEMLKTIIGNMMIGTKLSPSTAGPILELHGPSNNLEIFQNLLMEALKKESDDNNKCINSIQISILQLPRRVEALIRQLRYDFSSLKSRIGYAYGIHERLLEYEKQMNHSKNNIKTMNKLKRNLNMILIGQACLENGKSHLLMIFDILRDLVFKFNLEEKVPVYLRNKLCLSWQKIFAPHRYPNYDELLEKYKKLDNKNQYLDLKLDPMILGESVLNFNCNQTNEKINNSISTPNNNNTNINSSLKPQNNNYQLNDQKQKLQASQSQIQQKESKLLSSSSANRNDMMQSSSSSVMNNQILFNSNDVNHSKSSDCDKIFSSTKEIQINAFSDLNPNSNINNNKKYVSVNESQPPSSPVPPPLPPSSSIPFMNPNQRSNTPSNPYIANRNWESTCQAVFNEFEKGAGIAQTTKRTNKSPSVHWSRESIFYLEKLIDMVGFNPTLSNTIRRFLTKAQNNQLNVDEHKAIKRMFISAQSKLN